MYREAKSLWRSTSWITWMETTQCDNDLCFHKLNEEKKSVWLCDWWLAFSMMSFLYKWLGVSKWIMLETGLSHGGWKMNQSEDSRRTKTAPKFLKKVKPSQCGSALTYEPGSHTSFPVRGYAHVVGSILSVGYIGGWWSMILCHCWYVYLSPLSPSFWNQ